MKSHSPTDPSLKSNREAPKSSRILPINIFSIPAFFSAPTSVPVAPGKNTATGRPGDLPQAWSATLIALLSSSIDFGPEVVISS